MTFDLWDVETNKYLGHYEDESEALVLVRTLVAHYGSAYADDLELGGITSEGEIIESLSGAALIARADQVLSRRQTDLRQRRVGVGAKGSHRRSMNDDSLVAAATGPRQRASEARIRKRQRHEHAAKSKE